MLNYTALRSFDKDGNKFLDAEEVKAIVQKLDPGLTDDKIDALIKEADEDGDGHIDYLPRVASPSDALVSPPDITIFRLVFISRRHAAVLAGTTDKKSQKGIYPGYICRC